VLREKLDTGTPLLGVETKTTYQKPELDGRSDPMTDLSAPMPEIPADLAAIETLEEAVEAIKQAEEGMRSNWVMLSGAINIIKDRELWRENGHPNFESFIRIELGYSKQWVYKLLKIPQIVSKIDVTNPTAATELTSLDEDKWEEAWGLAKNLANQTEPTKVQVRKAVRAIKHGYQLTDDNKGLMGDKLREDMLANEVDGDPSLESSDHRLVTSQTLFDAAKEKLRSLFRDIEAISNMPEGIWVDMSPVKADFRNIANMLKFARPFSECINCEGNGCEKCLDSGVLNRERFEAYANSEKMKET
tara:strand:+ start:9234 stop:10142 length:909 start_codon:yes stop_codon:yes gene_type:complete